MIKRHSLFGRVGMGKQTISKMGAGKKGFSPFPYKGGGREKI